MIKKFESIDLYEALCLAVSIDEERGSFYEKLAEQTENKQVKNELLFLRDEERKNADYFAQRLEGMEDTVEDAGSCDPERLLHKWVEEEIIIPFQKAQETGTPASSLDALKLGVELQKKSIEFYRELILHEQIEQEKEQLNQILASEEQNLKKLNIIMSY